VAEKLTEAKTMSATQNSGATPDIGADLKTLKDDVGLLVRQLLEKNKDKLINAKDGVFDKAGDLADTAEKSIKDRPFLAVLIAFFIGLLFGAIARKA
jgi:ElaB/YqjD/DUF883 family membrane-anchored ribosome-binding protein